LLLTQYSVAQVDVVYSDLVWSDEFETNGVVSVEKWFHQTQLPTSGSWYNNEVQHYTNRIENSIVGSGILKIVAKRKIYKPRCK
jgi:predicted small secreted protein